MTGPLTVELVPLAALSEADIAEWRRLGSHAIEPNPYVEADLTLAAARHLAPAAGPLLLGAWDTGARPRRLLAALPVVPVPLAGGRSVLSTGRARWPTGRTAGPRLVASWRHDHAFDGTPLVAPGPDGVAGVEALVGAARSTSFALAVRGLRAGGAVSELLWAAAAASRGAPIVYGEFERAVLGRGPTVPAPAPARGTPGPLTAAPAAPRTPALCDARPSETGPSKTGPSKTGPSKTGPSETDASGNRAIGSGTGDAGAFGHRAVGRVFGHRAFGHRALGRVFGHRAFGHRAVGRVFGAGSSAPDAPNATVPGTAVTGGPGGAGTGLRLSGERRRRLERLRRRLAELGPVHLRERCTDGPVAPADGAFPPAAPLGPSAPAAPERGPAVQAALGSSAPAAAEPGPAVSEPARAPVDWRPAAVAFLALEAASWKGEAGTALACRPGDRAFFEEVCAVYQAAGRLRLDTLEVGERIIAVMCSIVAGEDLFLFKIAHDVTLDRFSPGVQLLVHVARTAPFATLDSGAAPEEAWLNALLPGRRRHVHVLFPPLGARGALWRAGARGLLAARARTRAAAPRLRRGMPTRSSPSLVRPRRFDIPFAED